MVCYVTMDDINDGSVRLSTYDGHDKSRDHHGSNDAGVSVLDKRYVISPMI